MSIFLGPKGAERGFVAYFFAFCPSPFIFRTKKTYICRRLRFGRTYPTVPPHAKHLSM
jgi:hypothetical protein